MNLAINKAAELLIPHKAAMEELVERLMLHDRLEKEVSRSAASYPSTLNASMSNFPGALTWRDSRTHAVVFAKFLLILKTSQSKVAHQASPPLLVVSLDVLPDSQ